MRRTVAMTLASGMLAVAVCAEAVQLPPRASGLFLDAGARVHTLVRPSEGRCALAVFPGGDLLLVSEPAGVAAAVLWRLTVDGRLQRLTEVRGTVGSAVAASQDAVLVAVEDRIERLDLEKRTASTVVDLGISDQGGEPDAENLALLDDGALLFSDARGIWRVAPGLPPRRVARIGSDEYVPSIVGLPDSAFAYVLMDGDLRLSVVRVEGGRRAPAARLNGRGEEPELIASGGELFAVGSSPRPGRPLLTRIVAGRTQTLARANPDRYLGDGDGAPLAAVGSLAWAGVASDGSLLISEFGGDVGCRVRALVPPSSGRAWLVVDWARWMRLSAGEVGVSSSVAGRLEVTVRRHGRVVARGSAEVGPGAGVVHLGRRLPRGTHDLRLRLVTLAGGVLTAAASVDTRQRLSVSEARRLVQRRVDNSDGDAADGIRDVTGACVRRSARTVVCTVSRRKWSNFRTVRRCRGHATVRLRPDGLHFTDSRRCPGR